MKMPSRFLNKILQPFYYISKFILPPTTDVVMGWKNPLGIVELHTVIKFKDRRDH